MKKIMCLIIGMGFWASPAFSIGEGEWRRHIIKAADEYESDHVIIHREFSFEAPMEWTGLCKQGQSDPAGSDTCFYDGTENWMYAPQIHCDDDGYCVEYGSRVPGAITKQFQGKPMDALKRIVSLGPNKIIHCTETQEEHIEGVDLALSAVCDLIGENHPYKGLAKKKIGIVKGNAISGLEIVEYYGLPLKDPYDLAPHPNLEKPVRYKDWRFKDIHDRVIKSMKFSYKRVYSKPPKKNKVKAKPSGTSKKK